MSTPSQKLLGRFSLPGALLFGAACLLAVTPGRAAVGADTWVGNTNPDFATGANWTGANTPPATGDSLVFGTAGTAGATLTDNDFTPGTYSFTGITFTAGASAYTINPGTPGTNGFTLTGGVTDNAANAEVVNDLVALSGTDIFNVNSSSGSLTLGGVLSGTGALTKSGAGTLTLTAKETYTGATTIDVGTLQIASSAASVTNASSTALNLNGGTLQVNSAFSGDTQTFTATAFQTGANVVSVGGTGTPSLALGAATDTVGAVIEFVGPATIGAGNVAVTATGTVTTTTAGGGADGLIRGLSTSGTINRVYATVGLYDYASTDTAAAGTGASPYTIIGGSQVTGFYETAGLTAALAGTSAVYDVNSAAGTTGNSLAALTYSAVQAVRFNESGVADTLTFGSGGSDAFNVAGILVTPNVGAVNETVSGYLEAERSNTVSAGYMTIWQNNTSGYLNASVRFDNGASTFTNGLIQAGLGTVVYSGVNANTGGIYLDGGSSVVTAETGFGAAGTTTAINLDGGAIVGNATFAMDNGSSATARGITLGDDGGGLAATTGNTMTIDGAITGSNVAGSTALTIGIAPSSANGNTVGLLPGSGTGTANPTPVFATGTVVLNNSTGNTYTNGTTVASGTLLAENTTGSATGSGSLTAASGTTLGGNGFINASSFNVTGASVLVGQTSTTDVNTTSGLTLKGTGASSLNTSTLNFNISTTFAGTTASGNILTVGSTALTFNSSILNVNLQGAVGASESGDSFELIAGGGTSTSTYSGLTTGINSLGQTVITGGLSLTGSVLSTYANSYLYLDNADDVDVYLSTTAVAAPEPRTTVLIMLGLGAFGMMHLRRRRQV